MKIREELLHFVWQYKLFDTHQLLTTEQEKLEIISFGKFNYDAGPDFSYAKIKVNDTILVGNIEIHTYSSDYLKHKHQLDDAYKNIILHVVFEEDKKIPNCSFPTLVLKSFIHKDVLEKYSQIIENTAYISCQNLYQPIDEFKYHLFAQKLCFERLDEKLIEIKQIFNYHKNDWNKTATILISAYMGQNINKEAFIRLLSSFDHKIIIKFCKNRLKTEALLMGQSGIIYSNYVKNMEHPYLDELRKEYEYLKALNILSQINTIEWKFAKMRPVAFPSVRISQLAHILFLYPNIFEEIIKDFDIHAIYHQLDVKCHEIWSPTNLESVTLGKTTIDIIIINAIVPLLFFYGRESGDVSYCEKAIEILEHLKAENNKITRLYSDLKFENTTALHSQALLELKKKYCDTKQCLKCNIGLEILKRS